jgi:hypothetical protein
MKRTTKRKERGMSVETKALSVARAYHRAWNSKEFEEAGTYLSEGLQVEVPINSYPTKGSFIEAVRRTREMTSKVEVLAEFGSDGGARVRRTSNPGAAASLACARAACPEPGTKSHASLSCPRRGRRLLLRQS